MIQEKTAARWRIGSQVVMITPDTIIDESQGPAVVGAVVDVSAWPLPDGTYEGILIIVRSGSVETDYFTDVIRAMESGQWLIGNRWVSVTGATQVVGDPAVGRTARVWLERPAGGSWTATRIEVEDPAVEEPVPVDGVISSFSDTSWVIDGKTLLITSDTTIGGVAPQVGYIAEALAQPRGNSLIAIWITVLGPEPTATWEPQPTATPTSQPTGTPTAEPTATATPEPPTATPEPTATATPEPPTATPEPTATATPEPPTATPEATATPTPDATATPV